MTSEVVVSISYPSATIVILSMHDEANKNALSPFFIEDLKNAISIIQQDKVVKVVVLCGTREVFCAGADRSTLVNFAKQALKPQDILLPKLILDIPIPVIAAMEGHAVGGGFALGLCADIILISETSRYGCNFMNMGFTPGMGTTRLLENIFLPVVAHELLYTGELKKGKEFKQYAAFNAILPKEEIFTKAMAIAERIAEKPRLSLELLKKTLSLPKREIFEQTITMESMMHRIAFADQEVQRKIVEEYVS